MGNVVSRRGDGQSSERPQTTRNRLSTAMSAAPLRFTRRRNDASTPPARSSPARTSPAVRSSNRISRLYRTQSTMAGGLPHILTRGRRREAASQSSRLSVPQISQSDAPSANPSEGRSLSPASEDDAGLAIGGMVDEQLSDLMPAETPLNPRISRSASPLERIRDMMPRHTLRRRRSRPMRVEDQTAMLTELLSAAAAATAASILGETGSPRRTVLGTENGAFQDFLQALRNGDIASALRSNSSPQDNNPSRNDQEQDLNFFRMFRFGPTEGSQTPPTRTSSPLNETSSSRGDNSSTANDSSTDNRMVPIIIVGIRSINPTSGSDNHMAPFFESLSNFPQATPTATTNTNIDSFLRPARNNTTFSHRRRTSTNSVRGLQRNNSQSHTIRGEEHEDETTTPVQPDHHHIPRRHSATSELLSTGSRPPPSTPASAGLSAFSSGTASPTTSPPSVGTQSAVPSRRGSFTVRRPGTPNIASTSTNNTESTLRPRIPRQRRFSEDFDVARYGSGSARRNGLVAPDTPEDISGTNGDGSHRSWIIYVLGGSYPENHPLLATPSLFTDNPQYEDMLLLASLLGPAKPPVATEEEVARAPGLFRIEVRPSVGPVGIGAKVLLRAVAMKEEEEAKEGGGSEEVRTGEPMDVDSETIDLVEDERCLVCLCDFEAEEVARRLVQCKHLFHRECIDQWLLTGRNSCPLCRTEGVEKSAPPAGDTSPHTTTSNFATTSAPADASPSSVTA